MGYRWECATCNEPYTIYQVVRHVQGTFTCWSENEKREHQKENPTHKLWGGVKVWKTKYPDEEKEHPNRKHRIPSKRQGCPQCGKSENIRYVSKGKLICKKCDYTFEKGEKK